MRKDPEVQQALGLYRLAIPKTLPVGRSGDLLGRGVGNSLEFQEYREYQMGDDLRHLDWAAYARSDTLLVRLFREEITPRIEILIDASKSMLTNGGIKAKLARQLTSLIGQLSGRAGGQPKFFWAGQTLPVVPMGNEFLDKLESLPFNSQLSLLDHLEQSSIPFKPQSIRIVISDFLFPHDPGILVKRLKSNASMLHMIQVLSPFEAKPEPIGGRRLQDVETGQEVDLLINRQVIQEYLLRLKRLQDELTAHARRIHGSFQPVIADHGLLKLCREELTQSGLLEFAFK
jgi:uncharacterized protein (DUF58 family)